MKYNIADTKPNRDLLQSIKVLVENDQELFNLSSNREDSITVRTSDPTSGELREDTYVLGGGTESAQILFDEQGSSLFSELRQGKRKETAETKWEQQIKEIATTYHEKYNVIAYDIDQAESREYRKHFHEVVGAFAEALNNQMGCHGDREMRPRDANAAEETTTYYSVKLRLNVRVAIEQNGMGSGKAQPIICRLFFRKDRESLVILSKYEATCISDSLKKSGKSSGDSAENEDANEIKNAVHLRLQSAITDDMFTRCALLADASKQWIEDTYGSYANIYLRCESMNIISYARIKSSDFCTDITDARGHAVLEVRYSLGQGYTIYCRNCMNENDGGDPVALVLNNRLVYAEDYIPKANEKPLAFDAAKLDSAKLSSADLQKHITDTLNRASVKIEERKDSPRQYKYELFYHVNGNVCPKICTCRYHVCDSQWYDNKRACQDCPHSEIKYMNPKTGAKDMTEGLRFVFNTLEMMPEGEGVHKCSCCNRYYILGASETLCPTCSGAIAHKEKPDRRKAHRTYVQYKKILSFGTRFKMTMGAYGKYAYEDDGIILFMFEKAHGGKEFRGVMVHRAFLFDKLLIREHGYISKAKEVHVD